MLIDFSSWDEVLTSESDNQDVMRQVARDCLAAFGMAATPHPDGGDGLSQGMLQLNVSQTLMERLETGAARIQRVTEHSGPGCVDIPAQILHRLAVDRICEVCPEALSRRPLKRNQGRAMRAQVDAIRRAT